MTERPILFWLHGLGGSAHTWRLVLPRLRDDFECVALDLPGHGSARESTALTVRETVNWLLAEVQQRQPREWVMIGHSMGGKFATIVSAVAEGGLAGLPPPAALVLVAASPLSPEPMTESCRQDMIDWCADGDVSFDAATTFVDANTATPLPTELRQAAVADVQHVDRVTWLSWLERGSLEDWRSVVRVVQAPTLVVAGGEDEDLGSQAQRELTLPQVNADEVTVVAAAAHLIPLEQPEVLAGHIAAHLRAVVPSDVRGSEKFRTLLASERVSAKTRQALLDRYAEPRTSCLTSEQLSVLTALVARVIPQSATNINIAARIDAQLAAETTDGWRFAELPDDAAAWRAGLDTLAARHDGFAFLGGPGQDLVIEDLIAGNVGSDEPGRLSAPQMQLWFEDVRAEAARIWMSHPDTMALIGYDGFANGGDAIRKQGYLRTGLDERERWQLDLPVVTARGRNQA